MTSFVCICRFLLKLPVPDKKPTAVFQLVKHKRDCGVRTPAMAVSGWWDMVVTTPRFGIFGKSPLTVLLMDRPW